MSLPMIFDRDGVVRDWPWLRAKYGNVQMLDAGNREKFALVGIRETEGPAVLMVRVLAYEGGPQKYQPVANHWPDPTLQDLSNGGLVTLWHERACVSTTNENGDVGYGLGGGSYIKDLAEGGPHTVWVLSPSVA